jgi:hypothetical protein
LRQTGAHRVDYRTGEEIRTGCQAAVWRALDQSRFGKTVNQR